MTKYMVVMDERIVARGMSIEIATTLIKALVAEYSNLESGGSIIICEDTSILIEVVENE